MNDLIRPTLYNVYHGALAVEAKQGDAIRYDVVGPVCESGDWLAQDRDFVIEPGALIAIESAGAYGFVMSNQYNSRPRAAEILVDGDKCYVVRRRETIEDSLNTKLFQTIFNHPLLIKPHSIGAKLIMNRPLSGIRVIEMAGIGPAPFAP